MVKKLVRTGWFVLFLFSVFMGTLWMTYRPSQLEKPKAVVNQKTEDQGLTDQELANWRAGEVWLLDEQRALVRIADICGFYLEQHMVAGVGHYDPYSAQQVLTCLEQMNKRR